MDFMSFIESMNSNLLTVIAAGVIALLLIINFIVLLAKKHKPDFSALEKSVKDEIANQENATRQEFTGMINVLGNNNKQAIEQLGNYLGKNQGMAAEMQSKQLNAFANGQNNLAVNVNGQLDTMRKAVSDQLDGMQKRLENIESASREGMREMRSENSKKLDEIRVTVDEKLQSTLEKRIAESFRTVNEQLELVYRGIGEMQTIANDVGSLKKILAGVKTRGILGEIQLGAILEEILSPEQYETNVAVVPGRAERVEYAVRLPGPDGTVYLPMDSKFPGERYQQLIDAQESGERQAVEIAWRNLEYVLKQEARDIHDKYICVPRTTNFAIMFLPFEGLYSEVVNRGLLESLQRDYQVNVAGPSTTAALLNSLQMGFRTLAIQKRSGEVWKVLGEVKTEFAKFEDGLRKMQGHLSQTNNDLESLIGTRTRAINRKLRDVQEIDTDADGDMDLFGVTR